MTTPDPIPAGPLLAEADELLPLDYMASLAQALLADALQVADSALMAPTTAPAAQFQLTTAGFHIERALTALGHLTPARQSDPASAAVGLRAIATPGEPAQTTPAKGEEPPPGSADALSGASSESRGAAGPAAGESQPCWHEFVPQLDRSGS